MRTTLHAPKRTSGLGASSRTPTQIKRVAKLSRGVSVASMQQRSTDASDAPTEAISLNRRDALSLLLALSASSGLASSGPALARGAGSGGAAAVSTYLPAADVEGFYKFIPAIDKTPALRSGAIDRPYSLLLPGNWKEERVANIKNGNYCQPKCGEPYTEALFDNEAEGKLEILNCPMFKLTPKPNQPLEKIGSPDNILPRIGPYITGTYLDDEDLVAQATKVLDEDRTYYYYQIYATYGTNGAHSYTAVTARGDMVFVVMATATEKQWAKSEQKLRTMVDSFRV